MKSSLLELVYLSSLLIEFGFLNIWSKEYPEIFGLLWYNWFMRPKQEF
jgi:hypothetical protein